MFACELFCLLKVEYVGCLRHRNSMPSEGIEEESFVHGDLCYIGSETYEA